MLPRITPEDDELIKRALSSFPNIRLQDLGSERLAEVSREHGLDFATALAFGCARDDVRAISCIRAILSYRMQDKLTHASSGAVFCLVPNLGYFEDPKSTTAGEAMLRAAGRLGFETLVVRTSHDVDLLSNADRVLDALQEVQGRQVVIASLSIGSAELKLAFQRWPWHRAFRQLRAWINICGLLYGTPVANVLTDSPTATIERQVKTWFASRGDTFVLEMLVALKECGWGTGRLLARKLNIPPVISLLNIVPFPLSRHILYPHTRELHRMIGLFGPNDGFGLLSDLLRVPGEIFPIWGSDHYVDLHVDVERLAEAVIHYAWSRSGGNSDQWHHA
jgi:hypothetical protein